MSARSTRGPSERGIEAGGDRTALLRRGARPPFGPAQHQRARRRASAREAPAKAVGRSLRTSAARLQGDACGQRPSGARQRNHASSLSAARSPEPGRDRTVHWPRPRPRSNAAASPRPDRPQAHDRSFAQQRLDRRPRRARWPSRPSASIRSLAGTPSASVTGSGSSRNVASDAAAAPMQHLDRLPLDAHDLGRPLEPVGAVEEPRSVSPGCMRSTCRWRDWRLGQREAARWPRAVTGGRCERSSSHQREPSSRCRMRRAVARAAKRSLPQALSRRTASGALRRRRPRPCARGSASIVRVRDVAQLLDRAGLLDREGQREAAQSEVGRDQLGQRRGELAVVERDGGSSGSVDRRAAVASAGARAPAADRHGAAWPARSGRACATPGSRRR